MKKADEDLKTQMYAFAKTGEQADGYTKTTKAIGEYVGKTYGHEMNILVMQLTETQLVAPTLADEASRQAELLWSKNYDIYLKKKDRYEEQKAKVFALILGQCELPVKNLVESQDDYDTVAMGSDVIALLKMIKEAVFGSNDKKYPPRQAARAWLQLIGAKQQPEESLVAYYKRFVSLVERVETTYGSIAPTAVAEKDPKYASRTAGDLTKLAREQMVASMFMDGAHHGFKPLMRDLENDFALGSALYPGTMSETLQVMTVYAEQPLYKSIMKKTRKSKDDDEAPELSFAQMNKKEMMKRGLCFKCGKQGHRAKECPETEQQNVREEQQHAQTFSWMG
jgi:Zinc knuckle